MDNDEKAPLWALGYWAWSVSPLGLYVVALIIGAFAGGDFREIVREFLPVAIIYGLACIMFFLAAIATLIDDLRKANR